MFNILFKKLREAELNFLKTTSIITLICFSIFASHLFFSEYNYSFLLYSSKKTGGQIYWKTKDKGYTQNDCITYSIKPGIFRSYEIPINRPLKEVEQIRFDPGSAKSNYLELLYFQISRSGFKPYKFNLENVSRSSSISNLRFSNKLIINTTSIDPMIYIDVNSIDMEFDFFSLFYKLLFSFFIGVTVAFSLRFFSQVTLDTRTTWLTSCLTLVFGMSLTMAINGRYNGSPDEHDHFLAAEYFKHNSLSPGQMKDEALHTYNYQWSYSRVYQTGFHYIIAGKFSNLFDSITESFISVRFFGVFLLLLLALIASLNPSLNLLFLPVLITPQVWYLFSYINDGYLPLFLSFTLILLTEKYKNSISNGATDKRSLIKYVLLGFIFGLILLSKKNYVLIWLFYPAYLFTLPYLENIKSLTRKISNNHIRPSIIILLVSFALFGVFSLNQSLKNNSSENLKESSVSFYKFSENKKSELYKNLRSGKDMYGDYWEMLPHWASTSFKSFTGGYGFMAYFGSLSYYKTFAILYISILTLLVLSLLKAKNFTGICWLVIFLASVLIMIYGSSYFYSFASNGYQPQGRYNFPVLPILGLFLYRASEIFESRKIFYYLYTVIFALGVYSFAFIGITSLV